MYKIVWTAKEIMCIKCVNIVYCSVQIRGYLLQVKMKDLAFTMLKYNRRDENIHKIMEIKDRIHRV